MKTKKAPGRFREPFLNQITNNQNQNLLYEVSLQFSTTVPEK
jgi:hypothetical protein